MPKVRKAMSPGRVRVAVDDYKAVAANQGEQQDQVTTETDQDVGRSYMLAKAYYATTSGAGVFLFPYVNLFLRGLGMSDSEIGVLSALRPWLGMAATMGGPILADKLGIHRAMLIAGFGLSTVLRGGMWASHDLLLVALLLLAADVVAGPVGPMAESMVLAACKSDADYGKQRVWGSIGWGAIAPLAGFLVQRHGLGAAFLGYGLLSIPAMMVVAKLQYPKGSPQHKDAADRAKNGAKEHQHSQEGEGSPGSEASQAPLVDDRYRSSGGLRRRRPTVSDTGLAEPLLKAEDTPSKSAQHAPTRDAPVSPQAGYQHPALSLEDRPTAGSPQAVLADQAAPASLPFSPGSQNDHSLHFSRTDLAADPPAAGHSHMNGDGHRTSQSGAGVKGALAALFQRVTGSPRVSQAGSEVPMKHIPQAELQMQPSPSGSVRHRASQAGALSPTAETLQQEPQEASKEPRITVVGKPASTPEGDSFAANMKVLFSQSEVWQLLFASLAIGFGQGIIGTYLFLYAQDMQASALLMGLLLTTDCVAESPVFFHQGAIMSFMGPATMLNVALLAMVVRLLLYASVPLVPGHNPWFILPIELLQGLTLAVGWSAACVLCKRLAPPGLQASLQGLMTAVFAGLGGGMGALLGGVLLEQKLGWSATWSGAAVLVAVLWMGSAAAPALLNANKKPQLTSPKKV